MKLALVQVLSCKHPLSCHPLLSPQFLHFLVAPVVEKVDSAIVWVNLYQVDSAIIGFHNTYPLDSGLSGGWRHPTFEQLGLAR